MSFLLFVYALFLLFSLTRSQHKDLARGVRLWKRGEALEADEVLQNVVRRLACPTLQPQLQEVRNTRFHGAYQLDRINQCSHQDVRGWVHEPKTAKSLCF